MAAVSIEQITRVPESTRRLPKDELFVQLGCVSCPRQVCFIAHGITAEAASYQANPEAARDLNDIVDGVDKGQRVSFLNRWRFHEACKTPCPEASNIETAVSMLNDRFDSKLRV